CASKCCSLAGRIHQFPGEVVVRSGSVTDSPMRHGTVGVGRPGFFKAGDGFLVVEAKTPVEASVEPALSVRRSGGHLAHVAAEIIGIIHVASPPSVVQLARGRNCPRAKALPIPMSQPASRSCVTASVTVCNLAAVGNDL